jgi:Uma2 family endonuclease
MTAIAQMPITANRLKKRLENEPRVFVPATVEEYWQLIETPQLRLDYFNHQIVATTSYGSLNHETIVTNVGFMLNFNFREENGRVFLSNRPVYAAVCDDIFNPDVHLVAGTLQEHFYKRSKTATLNPSIVVEVMSDSTKEYDMVVKLPCYQRISSVQHIVYIEQDQCAVSVYSRKDGTNDWTMEQFDALEDSLNLLDKSFNLRDIYRNINF